MRRIRDHASAVAGFRAEHVYSGKTDGYPTLAFQDSERSIMIVFTDMGKARDLAKGISERLTISSHYNVVMHLFAPEHSAEARLEVLKGLGDRPVEQLIAAAPN